jgi:hypothetical protein
MEIERHAAEVGMLVAVRSKPDLIPRLRKSFNLHFTEDAYQVLLKKLDQCAQTEVHFRVAETPVFLTRALLMEMADAGARLTKRLLKNPEYLVAANRAIPAGWRAAGASSYPNFLTADFALVRDASGARSPRLVEIQAFPSLYGYQLLMAQCFREAYALPPELEVTLSGLSSEAYWSLLRQTVLGTHKPQHVVLVEIDPEHQKTLPDFNVTSEKLGIPVVDVRMIEADGRKLYYRNQAGDRIQIYRIYNRAIADELIVRKIQLPFSWTDEWEVEWAGHPNWYFLISKFSLPWLTGDPVVPPCVFLDEFLDGPGRERLLAVGVQLPGDSADAIYDELLLKPLFSFAGKGIHFSPTHAELEAIPAERRSEYLLQQRMHFERTIDTPEGATQAEIRILYLWPDGGELTPVLPLIRLGRGKMMGVDHNRDLLWVGASAALIE